MANSSIAATSTNQGSFLRIHFVTGIETNRTSCPARTLWQSLHYSLPSERVKLLAKEKRNAKIQLVSFRTCKVSCLDANGAEHAVQVTARSLYEAVARGLHVLRQNNWVDGIHQNSTITIAVKEPEVEHKVRIRDFENWLASNGKSPAEQALKSDLRALLNPRMEEKPKRRE